MSLGAKSDMVLGETSLGPYHTRNRKKEEGRMKGDNTKTEQYEKRHFREASG